MKLSLITYITVCYINVYNGIPIFGLKNWIAREVGKITVFDWEGETIFGSSHREAQETEGLRNRDSTVQFSCFQRNQTSHDLDPYNMGIHLCLMAVRGRCCLDLAISLRINIYRNVYHSVKRICTVHVHVCTCFSSLQLKTATSLFFFSDLSIDAMDVSGEQQVWTCILQLFTVK